MDYGIIKKALVKANQLRLGIDETINLIQMYEEIAGDVSPGFISDGGRFVQQANSYPSINQPDPPPVIDPRAVQHESTIRTFSATASLIRQSESAYIEKSAEQMYQEIIAKSPRELLVTAPGYTHPMKYHVDAWKDDDRNTAGMTFSTFGDRSIILGRVVYQYDKPYDVEKDIQEFIDAQKQVFRARDNPVVARTPAPKPYSMGNADALGSFTADGMEAERVRQDLIRSGVIKV